MKKEIANIIYEINKDVELMAIIQLFTNFYKEHSKFLTPFNFDYIERIKNYFSSYKNHHVIGLFDELFQKGFSFQLPFQYVVSKNPKGIIDDRLTIEDLKRFDKALNDFSEVSRFNNFFETNKLYLEDVFKKNILMIKNYNIHTVINSYFQTNYPKFHVIFSPQLLQGGYGLNLNGVLASLVGPLEVKDFPVFCDKVFLIELIIHEITHNYVEKITKENLELIKEKEDIILKRRKEKHSFTYSTARSYFDEVLVRAITLDIILNSGYLDKEEFIKLYRENTEEYPFVVEILEGLRKRKDSKESLNEKVTNIIRGMDI